MQIGLVGGVYSGLESNYYVQLSCTSLYLNQQTSYEVHFIVTYCCFQVLLLSPFPSIAITVSISSRGGFFTMVHKVSLISDMDISRFLIDLVSKNTTGNIPMNA